MQNFTIKHHGAVNGVTGSCHELGLGDDFGLLIDCGLFQGAEISAGGDADPLVIEFPVSHIKALVVTHVHIDHVGRIPYLLAAGFTGSIICSEPSAVLLPLVLEDAVKIGFSRDPTLVRKFLALLRKRIVALPYKQWHCLLQEKTRSLRIRLQPAGHILGSAYVECELSGAGGSVPAARTAAGTEAKSYRIVFSGDLGAPYAPLLPAPRAPQRCDTLVIESTYGDTLHENRRSRQARLKRVIERALRDDGVVLIPAFSIGRTQEILYELEGIIAHETARVSDKKGAANKTVNWSRLAIIVDSPLANRFTASYRTLKPFWDKEALARVRQGRHPLDFEQLVTIGSHQDHIRLVNRLQSSHEPCVVIAASGMCAGGRVVNYLKALIGEPKTDILFIGYQAQGTPGRDILNYGATYGTEGGYVELDGERFAIRAGVHQISGYSAHADQQDLLNFVQGMKVKPTEIRIVHGDVNAKQTLRKALLKVLPTARVWIPSS